MKQVAFLFFLLCFFAGNVFSEDVKFTATTNGNVAVGEQFVLVYSVNAEANRFTGPSIKNFDVLAGPNQSSSSSIQIINGSVTQTVSLRYTYYLMANSEGTFTIPPASVFVNGKKYSSNTVTIRVSKESSNANSRTPNRQNYRQQQNDFSDEVKGQSVFLKANVNKFNPMQGEQVLVTYKIYFKGVQISQFAINKLATYSGFWAQELTKENTKPKLYTEIVDGERYNVAEIRKVALYPQKTGKLTIAPLEVETLCQMLSKNRRRSNDPFFDDFFSDFFGPTVQNVKKTLKSNSLSIDVKPLPSEGKLSGFSGAVGNFVMKSEIDRTSLKANESVTLKISISGSGNLKLIDKVDVQLPPDFETYDPKITDRINTSESGISGTRTFEYLMVPRNAGKYTIKPVFFSYFDLNKQKYITLTSPEFVIDVAKGDGKQASVTYSSQEEVKVLTNDIRFIKSQHFVLQPINSFFFGSGLFYLLWLLPFVLLGIFIFVRRNSIKKRSDLVKMKHHLANKIAVQRLKTAQQFLEARKSDDFYEEISKALWGYLGNKFNISLAELSLDNVKIKLLQHNISEPIISGFMNTLDDCEFVRFAPGEPFENMESVYQKAKNVIINIEKELKT